MLVNGIVIIFIFILLMIGFSQLAYLYSLLQSGASLNDYKFHIDSFTKYFNVSSDTGRIFIYILLIFILILCVYLFFYSFLGNNIFYHNQIGKPRYAKTNYHHLQNMMERKRGLFRMQYDDAGKLTDKTLEFFLEKLFYPLYKLQNKIMMHYHSPLYKYWNLREHKKVINDFDSDEVKHEK